jgi:hypothetical protein
MGVKSLNKCLNRYPKAAEGAKNIANRLISLEENLTNDLKAYL